MNYWTTVRKGGGMTVECAEDSCPVARAMEVPDGKCTVAAILRRKDGRPVDQPEFGLAVTNEQLQIKSLGPARIDSPLRQLVIDRRTSQHYVGESDRVLLDDTVDMVAARGMDLAQLP